MHTMTHLLLALHSDFLSNKEIWVDILLENELSVRGLNGMTSLMILLLYSNFDNFDYNN